MSKEGLQNFLRFLSENQEAQTKAQEFKGDTKALAGYARENGYDVIAQEIEEYQNKIVNLFKTKAEKKLNEATPKHFRPGVENFKKFLLMAETDQAAAKIVSYDTKDIIAYGRERGLDFDEEDMRVFTLEMMEQTEELSDEELEAAAGGTTLAAVIIVMGVLAFAGVGAAAVVSGGAAAAAVAVVFANKYIK